MRFSGRVIVAIVAALAIFVVGTTCTQAGCLLPGQQSGGAAAVPGNDCCRAHAKHTTPTESHGERSKPCPACQQPLFSSTTLSKTVADLSHTHAVIPFLTPPCPEALNVPIVRTTCGDLSEGPPGQPTPTLLALRCAFLI
jgi:hypothetical protein